MQKSFLCTFGMLLLLLGVQRLQAQNVSVSNYLGDYTCISHGVAGLSIQSTALGQKMIFCKDLIMNTCEEFSLYKRLGNFHDLLADGGDSGTALRGITAIFSSEGSEPILNIKLEDGITMEFVKR